MCGLSDVQKQWYGAHGATHDVSGEEAMVILGTAEALNEWL